MARAFYNPAFSRFAISLPHSTNSCSLGDEWDFKACGGGYRRGDPGSPLFDFRLAVERTVAAEAAHALPFPLCSRRARTIFFSTTRAWMKRSAVFKPSKKLKKPKSMSYFAPGLPDLTAVRTVCAAVSKPFNFMVGIKGKSFFGKRTRIMRSAAHQPGDLTLPSRNDRLSRSHTRGER